VFVGYLLGAKIGNLGFKVDWLLVIGYWLIGYWLIGYDG